MFAKKSRLEITEHATFCELLLFQEEAVQVAGMLCIREDKEDKGVQRLQSRLKYLTLSLWKQINW